MDQLFGGPNRNLILALISVILIGYLFQQGYFSVGGETELESGSEPVEENFEDYVTHTELLPDGKYVIRETQNGRYCTDDPNGMICRPLIPGPLEIFTFQHLNGDKYAIKGYRSGLWCSLTSTGMRCESPVVGDWEVFNIRPMGDNTYSIQSARNGRWCVDAGSGMQCDLATMGGWNYMKFEIIPIRFNNIK